MLRSRIIPCLLIHNKGLVKTVQFKSPKYVGDPINAVKIFNEKKVDELVILDIDATTQGYEPDLDMIEKVANECRMPLCYGGGVKTPEQANKIISLGVEKVALSSAAIDRPSLLAEIADIVGMQSVVVIIDIKKSLFGTYQILTHNAKRKAKISLEDYLQRIRNIGVGEVIINSIDRDGMKNGLDMALARNVRSFISSPMTILGGVGNLNHIKQAIDEFKIIGVSAGSFFVFKGVYDAVLISYPSEEQLRELHRVNK